MKTKIRYIAVQACCAGFILLFVAACSGRRNEVLILPPETALLSQEYVGYAVIYVLYTRLSMEPAEDSPAAGHARRGTVVRIHERRLIRDGNRNVSWLLIEGETAGWIREEFVNVYANVSQARTAAEAMR